MQKLHDRKNIGKILLDPSLEPKPKPEGGGKTLSKDDSTKSQDGDTSPPPGKPGHNTFN